MLHEDEFRPSSYVPQRTVWYTPYMAYDFSTLSTHIQETQDWLVRELSGIRTGRATPTLLDSIRVDAYGARTAIAGIASITIEDARTLRIVPWDASLAKAVETAINDADLGVSPVVDGTGMRVIFPMLTAERRAQLGKLANEKLEQAKVTLRGHRTDAIKALEAAEKGGGMGQDELERHKADIQKRIDAGTEALEALAKRKHVEISE
jgi:ribosome recycling factor